MLDGHMRHQDHLGNVGELKSGGAQWMTAGRGIIHSEMPQQESGRMRGFQLWINLPAREKMKPAGYRDLPACSIPRVNLPGGGSAKVVAGTVTVDGVATSGPIDCVTTRPLFVDVGLADGGQFAQSVPSGYNAFVYPYEGNVMIGDALLGTHQAGVLSAGDQVTIRSAGGAAKFLLLAAQPLGEPVVQHGPFVMNSRQEIEQAIRDYQSGTLTAPL
jgi:redox-sensitive bicupin YhaK (pirin superfamily)